MAEKHNQLGAAQNGLRGEASKPEKSKRDRSPGFPFIDLESALKRCLVFYEKERRHPAAFKTAASHWGFKEKSSGALQTIAALKGFGLMKDVTATTGGRTVQLTELALQIILDEREPSSEREEAIKKAALLPKMHAEVWKRWGPELPSDEEFRHRLRFDWKFNERSLNDFIQEYKDTIQFAKLSDSDIISDDMEDSESKTEGQWNADGKSDFRKNHEVVWKPPRGRIPPKPGMNNDVFTLDEGEAVLQWPSRMSPESYADFKAWLNLISKRAARAAGISPEPQPENVKNSEK